VDIGSLLLITAIIILVSYIVSRPFFSSGHSTRLENGETAELLKVEQKVSGLMSEKDRLFAALQELDADHDLGKLPADVYASERANLLLAAARVLRVIDETEAQLKPLEPVENGSSAAILEIPLQDGALDGIEEMVAARRRSRNEKSAGFCPHCGKVIQKSDQFCPACGSKVSA
jgi:hypothetical protein